MSYVSNIASSILSRTDGPTLLGPDVYTAIAEWEKREIPAEVVLRAIEEVYRYSGVNGIKDVPLEMVQQAVALNFTAWLSSGERGMAA